MGDGTCDIPKLTDNDLLQIRCDHVYTDGTTAWKFLRFGECDTRQWFQCEICGSEAWLL